MRDYLEVSARKGNAEAIRDLTPPEYPARYQYLLDWFFELHGRRGSGMNGPAALTWGDFDAWARRMNRHPSPWDFRVLCRIDDAFFASAYEAK